MALSYGTIDEATARGALNRLEAICATQDAKLDYLNSQVRVLQDAMAAATTEAAAGRGAQRQEFLVNHDGHPHTRGLGL